jgi:hypothetical protein
MRAGAIHRPNFPLLATVPVLQSSLTGYLALFRFAHVTGGGSPEPGRVR